MAYDIPGPMITLEAAADLSTHQYKFVTVDANGRAALCGDNGNCVGILQNKPDALGKPATVMIPGGVSKFVGSGNLVPGTIIASDAAGKGKAAAALGPTAGTVLINPAVDGQIGTLLLQRGHFAVS